MREGVGDEALGEDEGLFGVERGGDVRVRVVDVGFEAGFVWSGDGCQRGSIVRRLRMEGAAGRGGSTEADKGLDSL